MIRAIYFALCFGLALFGLFVITQINLTLGLSMFALFIVKFFLMLPQYKEEWWQRKFILREL
jgi:hypothetical protein